LQSNIIYDLEKEGDLHIKAIPTKESINTIFCKIFEIENSINLLNLNELIFDRFSVTIIYSKTKLIDLMKLDCVSFRYIDCISAYIYDVQYIIGHISGIGYIILKLSSSTLNLAHRFILNQGIQHNYSNYDCHITIAKNITQSDEIISLIKKIKEKILFSRITFSSIMFENTTKS
jgi:hypothetical protein